MRNWWNFINLPLKGEKMNNWKEDKTAKLFLTGYKQYQTEHIPADIDETELELIYGNAIDNILKNGSTAILDVQQYAGEVLKKFYPTMIKYKDFLEIENVYDAYFLDLKSGVEFPPKLKQELLEISKLEYEYIGDCTFRDFLGDVQKTVSDTAQTRHLKEFKRKVRNGAFQ